MSKATAEYVMSLKSGLKSGENPRLCPECSHTRTGRRKQEKCLYVRLKDDGNVTWHCQHCGESGGIAPAHFEQRDHERKQEMEKTYVRPTLPESRPLSEAVINWFDKRGISVETLISNDIYVDGKRIAFPFKRGDEVVNIKYRTADKRFSQEKDAEKVYFGLNHVVGEKTLIIVEGEMDKLAFNEAGIWNVLSVPDGAPNADAKNTDKKFEYVGNCLDVTDQAEDIILACDNDPNGHALTRELARRLGKDKCRTVTWPEGVKDANDLLLSHGAHGLSDLVGKAKPYPIEDLFTGSSFRASVNHIYENGYGALFDTGWRTVDKLFKIRRKELSIVTGIPGSGKSEFIDALAVNMAKRHGWKFAICSFENPPEQHIAKLAHRIVGKRFFGKEGQRMSQDELNAALDWIDEHFLFIAPGGYNTTTDIEWILEKAQAAVKRHGIDGLIIDPYNEIDRDYRIQETEHVNVMLKQLKRFTHLNEIHTWLVAHPAKPKPQAAGEAEQVPNLYSISGSANFRNRADIGLTVHRPRDMETGERSNLAEVHVTKVRFANVVGQEGIAELLYDYDTAKYIEDGDVLL